MGHKGLNKSDQLICMTNIQWLAAILIFLTQTTASLLLAKMFKCHFVWWQTKNRFFLNIIFVFINTLSNVINLTMLNYFAIHI